MVSALEDLILCVNIQQICKQVNYDKNGKCCHYEVINPGIIDSFHPLFLA